MRRDLLNAANWLDVDTSLPQARSRVDGRVYPVDPLSDDQIEELAGCLEIATDPRVAWALADAVRASVRNLAAFFDTPPAVTDYEADQADTFEGVAADPARALDGPPRSEGARDAMDLLGSLAERHGLDRESRSGAAAIGDIAAEMAQAMSPRADAHFSIGEAQLFDDIIAIIDALAPADMRVGGNDRTPRKREPEEGGHAYPAVKFAEEFVGQVVDRTLASFPSDEDVRERLHKLKRKSTTSVAKGLREARTRHRRFSAVASE